MREQKESLRERLLAERGATTPAARSAAGMAITRSVLDLPELTACRNVAAYVSIGTEPPTMHLITEIRARGTHVVVPVLQSDLDLDWAPYDGSTVIAQASRGLQEPLGRRLGPNFLEQVDAVIVPGLAADERGMRLGRGGGSYDRALPRARPGVPVIVLLYDGEVLPAVPAEPHDRPVTIAVTPTRVWRF